MNGEEFFEEVAAQLDRLKAVPIGQLSDVVRREGACMWLGVGADEPTWTGDHMTDRELAVNICAGCPVADECLELEFRTVGFLSLGVWGALAEDDLQSAYLAWLQRREEGRR